MLDIVNKKLFLLLLLVGTVSYTKAQKLYFEPLFGTAATDYNGSNLIVDSIRVETTGSDNEGIRELRTVGLNVGYILTDRLDVLSGLSFAFHRISYAVYNELSNCQFCPVKKSGGQTFFDIQLSVLPRFALLKGNKIKLYALAGPTVHFTMDAANDYTPIDDFNGQLPMVANVLNALQAAPGKTFFSFSYGGAIYYKRISLSVKYTENISNTITSNLEVEGVSYPFYTNFNRLSVTLAYQFYFRSKEEE